MSNLIIGQSQIGGKGLFAKREIPPNQHLCDYTGKVYTASEAPTATQHPYALTWPYGRQESMLVGNPFVTNPAHAAQLANDGAMRPKMYQKFQSYLQNLPTCKTKKEYRRDIIKSLLTMKSRYEVNSKNILFVNSEFRTDKTKQIIFLLSLTTIDKGSEILTCYGFNYWFGQIVRFLFQRGWAKLALQIKNKVLLDTQNKAPNFICNFQELVECTNDLETYRNQIFQTLMGMICSRGNLSIRFPFTKYPLKGLLQDILKHSQNTEPETYYYHLNPLLLLLVDKGMVIYNDGQAFTKSNDVIAHFGNPLTSPPKNSSHKFYMLRHFLFVLLIACHTFYAYKFNGKY